MRVSKLLFRVAVIGENGSDQRIGPTGHPDLVLVGDDRLAHPRFKEGFVPLARNHQQRRELEVAARDLHRDRPLPRERYSGSHVRNGGNGTAGEVPQHAPGHEQVGLRAGNLARRLGEPVAEAREAFHRAFQQPFAQGEPDPGEAFCGRTNRGLG
jgi:hypothetical protein